MERRRTSRMKTGSQSAVSKGSVRKGRQSPIRSSPPRKASPARASSKKVSPTEQKIPVKKMPENAPVAHPIRTKSSTTPTPQMLSSEVLKEMGDLKRLSPVVILKPFDNSIKNQMNMKTFSEHSIQSSVSETNTIKTSKTVETVDLGSIRADDLLEGDSEIAKLTSLAAFVRRSVSVTKNLSPRHQLTPTPSATTGRSRQSQSRSISRSVYDDDYSKTEYSDNDHEDFESCKTHFDLNSNDMMGKGMRTMQKEAKFKVIIAAITISLLLIALPTLGYYLLWTCNQPSCTLKAFKLTVPNLELVKEIFSVEKVGYYLGMTMFIQIFSMFPLGRVVNFYNNWGSVVYYFNSFAVGTMMTVAFGVAEYLQYPVAEYVLKNYLSFYLFGVLHAFILSFWCFVHSWYANPMSLNPYAKSGSAPVDFAIGREVNPHWFNTINVKLVCYRTSLLILLLLSEIFIYKNVNIPMNVDQGEGLPLEFYQKAQLIYENSSFDLAGLFTSVLLLSYVLDQIIFEHHLTSSFELQQEGVGGILLVRYAMTPFLLAAIPKFFFENKGIELPHWAIAITSTLFLLGLILKRKSNSVKYTYRMYPQSLRQAYLETVPTFQGRRLLLGKYWGRLRQPNYAGDVLSLLAFTIPLFWKFSWPPLICILLIVLNLFHRAVRVNKRNQARYESAWTRYCSKARYLIIPRIF